ncbi:hypothetical protein JZ751_004768, partial [Albula glossodonta]
MGSFERNDSPSNSSPATPPGCFIEDDPEAPQFRRQAHTFSHPSVKMRISFSEPQPLTNKGLEWWVEKALNHLSCHVVSTVKEESPHFWNVKGREALNAALNLKPNLHRAKNLILFLGDGEAKSPPPNPAHPPPIHTMPQDNPPNPRSQSKPQGTGPVRMSKVACFPGMGVSTVTAARILKGQMAGKPGEETVLTMETFPYLALSKTYNVDQQMPDSAGTGTAYHCGVKTNYGTLGLSAAARRYQCNTTFGNEVTSVLHRARMAGKSVGIVTTTRVQHASPAASYAHSANRHWYSDSDLPADAKQQGCLDVAYQLIRNTDINVILGGGRVYMLPKETRDPEYSNSFGDRSDKTNLIIEWLRNKRNAKYVWNKNDFDAVEADDTDYLMGLFEPKDTRYELERNPRTDPSLTEMVEKAIKILQKNPNGFYLFVED